MFNNEYILRASVLVLLTSLFACTGMQTFTTAARPGETVALGLGWRHHLTRDSLTFTITDADSNVFTYAPGDARIRSVMNSYPDPISKLRVGYETNQNIGGNEVIWGTLIEGNVTNWDRDWSQKFVIFDLPSTIAQGAANIDVSIALAGGGTETTPSHFFDILGGVGTSIPNPFINWEGFGAASGALKAMERANHYVVSFSGTTLPHAIQLDMVHDPDMDNGGNGRPYVANPGGNVKSILWTDNGVTMKVVLTPMRDGMLDNWSDFKFYVAGEITGLVVVSTSVQAFDINGDIVSGMDLPVITYQ